MRKSKVHEVGRNKLLSTSTIETTVEISQSTRIHAEKVTDVFYCDPPLATAIFIGVTLSPFVTFGETPFSNK